MIIYLFIFALMKYRLNKTQFLNKFIQIIIFILIVVRTTKSSKWVTKIMLVNVYEDGFMHGFDLPNRPCLC